MRYWILLGLFVFVMDGHAQNKKALELYNEAVKQYNQQNYMLADSLFGLSDKLMLNRDTYFARALCKGKLADKDGYCKELAYASAFGEEKATKLFLKTEGKIDTTYPVLKQNFVKTTIHSRQCTYVTPAQEKFDFTQAYYSQQSDSLPLNDPESIGAQLRPWPIFLAA